MGIHSMGRSSLMNKTNSNRSIIKGNDEREKKLVKRSVSANNYSGPKSVAYLMKNSSISTTARKATKDERDSRRNWQQRNSMYKCTGEVCSKRQTSDRESDHKIDTSSYNGYGAINTGDDSTDDNPCTNDSDEDPSSPVPQFDSHYYTKSNNGNSVFLGIPVPRGKGTTDGADNYENGNKGYRIIKTKADMKFENIEEQRSDFIDGRTSEDGRTSTLT